ncbi:MAG TPA: hypothetical protein VIB39_12660 [Candidatus Angelobacter sp.]|jgi:hypothetical protein
MADHLDSTNLVPFKKRHHDGYHLPGMAKEKDELIEEVDPALGPEEQGFVRHYLSYADILLKNAGGIENQPVEESEAAAADRDRMDGTSGNAGKFFDRNGSKNRAA